MTVKKTFSLTDRHYAYLAEKVAEGVFATPSAGLAAAVERLMEDERARDAALDAMAETIRARMATPVGEYVGLDEAFATVRGRLQRRAHDDDAA